MKPGKEITTGANVLLPQDIQQLVACERRVVLDLHDYVLIVRAISLLHFHECEWLEMTQGLGVFHPGSCVPVQQLIQPVDQCQTHRCMCFGELRIRSQRDDVVVTCKAEVAQQPQPLRQVGIARGYSAAFERVEEFGCVEAEHFRSSKVANALVSY